MQAAEDTELTEAAWVYFRRYKEARRYGFCVVDARVWAESDKDVGEMRKLKARGCSAKLAAKILLVLAMLVLPATASGRVPVLGTDDACACGGHNPPYVVWTLMYGFNGVLICERHWSNGVVSSGLC